MNAFWPFFAGLLIGGVIGTLNGIHCALRHMRRRQEAHRETLERLFGPPMPLIIPELKAPQMKDIPKDNPHHETCKPMTEEEFKRAAGDKA